MTQLPDNFLADLQAHVASGNIRFQTHPRFPLTIFNYTPQVQYSRTWDPVTLMCRGLILDDENNIVARPFSKFFNWGEWDPTKQDRYLGQPYSITDKLDGSLGILYHFDNAWHVATRGSFTSEQAQAAQAMLKSYSLADIPTEGVTPLVEIIYPENRIVVDYGATRDIFLLAALSTATGNRLNSFWWEGPRVNYLTLTLAEAIESKTTTGTETEGYVITFPDGEMAKIKLDEYVRLHRILTGTNAVRIWEALQDPDLWAILVEKVPDEFYQWVTITATDLSKSYRQIKHTAHREFEANRYLADTSRKDFALWAKDRPYNDILFRMLDGKDYDHNIWKRIKPEPTRPFREEI